MNFLFLIGQLALVFFGLIALVVLFVVIFGQRVEKLWEYEAEFRNELGQEFAEFEIEMSKVGKNQPSHTLKARLFGRHESLVAGQFVEVLVDDQLILAGSVANDGKISLADGHLQVTQFEPTQGQMCRVVVDAEFRWEAALRID